MVKVVFIEHDGNSHEVNAYVGESLMESAVSNNVPGIDADCGGNCACATCHVFVNPEWIAKVGERREMENSMFGILRKIKKLILAWPVRFKFLKSMKDLQ